ncbi:MAG: bifunctional phosphoribosyl-AMP cyclohydrolase/phosphoribosyl-ATP diphosphatase HisIE [Ruminococcaceae bacterium]|jgi:phosphoribosyl-ATP pyrophosphohydrolase/phosphoribosyl-AMP cyclohydrolase|nr:bifunctional phosphoribosyl-AMP cyclohydrolase/phosphoribosyl-ATP diphosphatase HisIE [Oscillospiraceae bacterium]
METNFELDKLRFDERGLIPVVVQDAVTGQVLTVAYMNMESLKISLEKELTCFYSRSRQTLWLKGETSGNVQHIVSITADCDYDALVVKVEPEGPACHLGTTSCFTNTLAQSAERKDFSLDLLMELIRERKEHPKEGSYTNYLFDKGLDKILKKVGEESTEVIIAAKDGDKAETVYEIADLTYHILVLMIEAGISLGDIHRELASRHVIDKKVKQERSAAELAPDPASKG